MNGDYMSMSLPGQGMPSPSEKLPPAVTSQFTVGGAAPIDRTKFQGAVATADKPLTPLPAAKPQPPADPKAVKSNLDSIKLNENNPSEAMRNLLQLKDAFQGNIQGRAMPIAEDGLLSNKGKLLGLTYNMNEDAAKIASKDVLKSRYDGIVRNLNDKIGNLDKQISQNPPDKASLQEERDILQKILDTCGSIDKTVEDSELINNYQKQLDNLSKKVSSAVAQANNDPSPKNLQILRVLEHQVTEIAQAIVDSTKADTPSGSWSDVGKFIKLIPLFVAGLFSKKAAEHADKEWEKAIPGTPQSQKRQQLLETIKELNTNLRTAHEEITDRALIGSLATSNALTKPPGKVPEHPMMVGAVAQSGQAEKTEKVVSAKFKEAAQQAKATADKPLAPLPAEKASPPASPKELRNKLEELHAQHEKLSTYKDISTIFSILTLGLVSLVQYIFFESPNVFHQAARKVEEQIDAIPRQLTPGMQKREKEINRLKDEKLKLPKGQSSAEIDKQIDKLESLQREYGEVARMTIGEQPEIFGSARLMQYSYSSKERSEMTRETLTRQFSELQRDSETIRFKLDTAKSEINKTENEIATLIKKNTPLIQSNGELNNREFRALNERIANLEEARKQLMVNNENEFKSGDPLLLRDLEEVNKALEIDRPTYFEAEVLNKKREGIIKSLQHANPNFGENDKLILENTMKLAELRKQRDSVSEAAKLISEKNTTLAALKDLQTQYLGELRDNLSALAQIQQETVGRDRSLGMRAGAATEDSLRRLDHQIKKLEASEKPNKSKIEDLRTQHDVLTNLVNLKKDKEAIAKLIRDLTESGRDVDEQVTGLTERMAEIDQKIHRLEKYDPQIAAAMEREAANVEKSDPQRAEALRHEAAGLKKTGPLTVRALKEEAARRKAELRAEVSGKFGGFNEEETIEKEHTLLQRATDNLGGPIKSTTAQWDLLHSDISDEMENIFKTYKENGGDTAKLSFGLAASSSMAHETRGVAENAAVKAQGKAQYEQGVGRQQAATQPLNINLPSATMPTIAELPGTAKAPTKPRETSAPRPITMENLGTALPTTSKPSPAQPKPVTPAAAQPSAMTKAAAPSTAGRELTFKEKVDIIDRAIANSNDPVSLKKAAEVIRNWTDHDIRRGPEDDTLKEKIKTLGNQFTGSNNEITECHAAINNLGANKASNAKILGDMGTKIIGLIKNNITHHYTTQADMMLSQLKTKAPEFYNQQLQSDPQFRGLASAYDKSIDLAAYGPAGSAPKVPTTTAQPQAAAKTTAAAPRPKPLTIPPTATSTTAASTLSSTAPLSPRAVPTAMQQNIKKLKDAMAFISDDKNSGKTLELAENFQKIIAAVDELNKQKANITSAVKVELTKVRDDLDRLFEREGNAAYILDTLDGILKTEMSPPVKQAMAAEREKELKRGVRMPSPGVLPPVDALVKQRGAGTLANLLEGVNLEKPSSPKVESPAKPVVKPATPEKPKPSSAPLHSETEVKHAEAGEAPVVDATNVRFDPKTYELPLQNCINFITTSSNSSSKDMPIKIREAKKYLSDLEQSHRGIQKSVFESMQKRIEPRLSSTNYPEFNDYRNELNEINSSLERIIQSY